MNREAWIIKELEPLIDGTLIREAEVKAEREWRQENGEEPPKRVVMNDSTGESWTESRLSEEMVKAWIKGNRYNWRDDQCR